MNEDDYKVLISGYQQKSLDLFTQLAVSEAKLQVLQGKLNEANALIETLTQSKSEGDEYA